MTVQFHGDFGHVCRLSFMVPVDTHLRLSLAAQAEKLSISEMVRRVLDAALPNAPAEGGEPEPETVAVVRLPPADPKPEKDPLMIASPLELFRRGYSGTQIAAIKRIPYAAVMKEIGRGVDGAMTRMERSGG